MSGSNSAPSSTNAKHPDNNKLDCIVGSPPDEVSGFPSFRVTPFFSRQKSRSHEQLNIQSDNSQVHELSSCSDDTNNYYVNKLIQMEHNIRTKVKSGSATLLGIPESSLVNQAKDKGIVAGDISSMVSPGKPESNSNQVLPTTPIQSVGGLHRAASYGVFEQAKSQDSLSATKQQEQPASLSKFPNSNFGSASRVTPRDLNQFAPWHF